MAQSLTHPEERTAHPADAPGHGQAGHDHVEGSMDVSAHERTFHSFMTFVTRVAIGIVVALVVLALVNA